MNFIQKLENWLDSAIKPTEKFSHDYLLMPFRAALEKLDPLAERLNGTKLKRVLQIIVFPIFIFITLPIGFKLVENGYNTTTFIGSILIFMVYGAIWAPLERLIPFSKRWHDDKELPTDWFLFFGGKLWGDYINQPLKLATISLVVQEISPTIGQDLWPLHFNPWLQVFILLSIKDFFRYWYHRWMHENEFMWRWHAVHHSSERLYWFNGTRNHPLEGLVSSFLWAIPFAFIQAPVEIVFVTGLLGRTIGRFQHTNMDLKLGIFDYIFSSPKNHRYHHSKIHTIGHTNYGGDVIFWDILFGTFYLPKGQEPSDEIGIEEMPNYPKSFVGLMFAPFTYGRLKREAGIDRNKET